MLQPHELSQTEPRASALLTLHKLQHEMDAAIKWMPRRRRKAPYGFHISKGAAVYLVGLLLIGLVAVNADINLLMVLFGLGAGAMVVSAFFNWLALRRISVSRIVPDVVLAGQPFIIRYTLSNRRRWGMSHGLHVVDALSPDARMAPPEAFIPCLRPTETCVVDVPAVCPKRGRIPFDRIVVATRFPFGLFTKYATFDAPIEIVVFPQLGRLLADVGLPSRTSDITDGGGPSNLSGDEEFYGVREYRAGDNPHRIHWRRSARTGQLMVREMSRTRAAQIWCIVDTRVAPGNTAASERLERTISCVATVVCDALERGAQVGLLCNGEPLLVLPPGGGRAHRPRLLRELALRTENHTDRLTPHLERLAWPARWRGPCLLFGADDSEDLHQAARVLARVVGPPSIHVADTPQFDGLFSPVKTPQRSRTIGDKQSAFLREPTEGA